MTEKRKGIWLMIAAFAVAFAAFYCLFGVSIDFGRGLALVIGLFIVAVVLYKAGADKFWGVGS